MNNHKLAHNSLTEAYRKLNESTRSNEFFREMSMLLKKFDARNDDLYQLLDVGEQFAFQRQNDALMHSLEDLQHALSEYSSSVETAEQHGDMDFD